MQPPHGHPPGYPPGYPPQQPYPPQGYPPQNYPPPGYPPQGYPPPGYPPQGHPPQGYPPQGPPHQGYSPQGHPPQGYPGGGGPRGPTGGGAKRVVLIVSGALGGMLLVALIVYFTVFHYKPVAALHIPPGTTAAIRVDLVEVATFGPIRRHLIPLANELSPGAVPTGAKTRTERVGEAVGFNPDRDLREVIVCFLGSPDRVVVLVGGNIPKGKLVPGLKEVAAQEKSTAWVLAGDLLKASGVVVGQAEDGTAIVASDEQGLRAALPETQEQARLGLAGDRAVSYAVAGDLWQQLAGSPYGSMLESLRNLRTLGASTGWMTLGNAPRLESRVQVVAGASPEDAKATLYRIFTDLRRLSELRRKLDGSAIDFAGEEQALAQSGIETKEGNVLRVSTPWPYDGLDRGARELAQKIRRVRAGLGGGSTQPPGMMLPGGIPMPLPLPGFP